MPEELVIRHCSPTLAGLKTGNMFTCTYETKAQLCKDIAELNRCLRKKGLSALPLKYKDSKALIYIYRPSKLERDLRSKEACRVLKDCGYKCEGSCKCIARLMQRLRENDEFPHEIGLFLGYPPEDVIGFIEHKTCKLTGFWKVYGDAEKAQKCFESYRKCTRVYGRCWENGSSLEHLTVKKQ